MSVAQDLYSEVMDVIYQHMKNGAGYADVFGALKMSQGYFETEMAFRIGVQFQKELKEEC